MEHGVVEDAVDRNGGANAKCERKDRRKGKAWITEDLPERKAEILEQYLHQRLLWEGEGYRKTRDNVSRSENGKVDATIKVGPPATGLRRWGESERRSSTEFNKTHHLWFCRRLHFDPEHFGYQAEIFN
jgi:hypothetical protein